MTRCGRASTPVNRRCPGMIVGSQFGAGIGLHGNISGLDRSTATHSHVDLVHRTPTYWRPSDHRERIEAGYPPTTATRCGSRPAQAALGEHHLAAVVRVDADQLVPDGVDGLRRFFLRRR